VPIASPVVQCGGGVMFRREGAGYNETATDRAGNQQTPHRNGGDQGDRVRHLDIPDSNPEYVLQDRCQESVTATYRQAHEEGWDKAVGRSVDRIVRKHRCESGQWRKQESARQKKDQSQGWCGIPERDAE
jgi:hypothetical protein